MTEKILEYARQKADDLELDMKYIPRSQGYGGYWKVIEEGKQAGIDARAASALEFLRLYAGADSQFTTRATTGMPNGEDVTGVRAIAQLMREWANQVEAGISEIAGSRSRAEIAVVSTDLMGQVRMLLADSKVHLAAPVVLAGAALEIALQSLADARGTTVPAPTSLSKFANALRSDNVLSKQEVKEIEVCAGLRNDAAHGNHVDITPARARMMEQQVTLLLHRIADLHP